jgi:hypothetical protein
MTPLIQSNAQAFTAAFNRYMEVTGRTPAETIVRQAGNFATFLRKRLRVLAPEKGSIRREAEQRLASGGGLTIRQAVRDYANKNTRATATSLKTRRATLFREVTKKGNVKKNARNWWQLAVAREINFRERGIGFTAYSAAFRGLRQFTAQRGTQRTQVIDRYKRFLSAVGVKINANETGAIFGWGGNRSSGEVAKVLKTGQGQQAVADALMDARSDMMVYVARRLQQNAAKTVGRIR